MSAEPVQPALVRQLSDRSHMLEYVGLHTFRDRLVEHGLESIHDFPKFSRSDLQELGMSDVQCNIYQLLVQTSENHRASESVPQESQGNEDTSLRGDDREECPVCEEEDRVVHAQQCCGFQSCNDCLRRHMVIAGHWHGCPNPDCDAPTGAQDQSRLLEGYCCVCAESNDDAPFVQIGCGFDHEAHTKCLQDHIAGFLSNKKYPLLCPAFELCKCSLVEKLVLECLSSEDTKRGSDEPEVPPVAALVTPTAATAAASRSTSTTATLLHKYYDLAIKQATTAHRNHVQCPNPRCGQEIDLGPSSGARSPGSRVIHCGHCRLSWCGSCHQNAHEGIDCESFSGLKMQWLQFVAKHSSCQAGELQRQLRNHEDLIASERFKGEHMRHCPHCGLEVLRTDGCSDVTCGRDATDKGNLLHSNLGCGEHFNWNEARRYKPKVNSFSPAPDTEGDMFESGLVLPPRLCRMCFKVRCDGCEPSQLRPWLAELPCRSCPCVQYSAITRVHASRTCRCRGSSCDPIHFYFCFTSTCTVANCLIFQPTATDTFT